ncbi:MAG: GTP pyrophosphokinase [Deltaproteobacteria bacterium]|nr:GTP pyrophosphokinase [Deltaproteobacteria bacterium]MBW2016516.1 GTP pyrophosphokinase [Deltaproteobacteria bacterium]MBW2128273.1 GTP pyrophosphokinase [Deltaproteobacteria bacterium]MBW2302268.1 GTP pyrophosphokinase [Deltaproteobacteria bacterium]
MERALFLEKYSIRPEEFERAGLSWEELLAIRDDHRRNQDRLEAAARYVSDRLGTVEEVHSIKTRIKDPEHLIEKIIRKRLEDPTLVLDRETYRFVITDLAGVRALHLFKEDWEKIHEFIIHTWELRRNPVANVCEDDHDRFVKRFKERGCEIHKHPFGYRSVHYLVSFAPSKVEFTTVEIQVRTILEEAWSEIDHMIRYPYRADKTALSPYLVFLNRLLGNADEMGSFIKLLNDNISGKSRDRYTRDWKNRSPIHYLKRDVDGLPVEMNIKRLLQERIQSLEKHLLSLKTMPSYDSVTEAFSSPHTGTPS